MNINDQQRTRIGASISHLNVQPLTNVNFSLSVGTVVPRDVRLQPLPADVVEIVPQYPGYNFVLVKDEIVIVEPATYKIVTVLPYSGRSTAAAPASTKQHKMTFTDNDREVIRKHAKARPVEREKRVTTGSAVRTEIRTRERVPEGVEIEAIPKEVYPGCSDASRVPVHQSGRPHLCGRTPLRCFCPQSPDGQTMHLLTMPNRRSTTTRLRR
ncbi:DUF1236 domain-containing protein [Bradyrhizobium monzae]|uniref:DUF1236 domain-containing protein n=1 Tax=Bradyrhizobium sp. Oc8 TaxID=2876780 RepID=UPI00320AC0C9